MAENKQVVITLRKSVEDQDKAQDFYDELKEALVSFEDLKISGHYSNHFPLEEPIA